MMVMNGMTLIQSPAQTEILTPEATAFLSKIADAFEHRRQELLAHRRRVQQEIDSGKMPDFLPETAAIRERNWQVAPVPKDLLDRRVEITGPVDRKMIINALNSGADVFMADFEDSNSPTWENTIEGQANLRHAVQGTISYLSPEGKQYRLGENPATLVVRPRGWHLVEKHFLVQGKPISASLFDFGLFSSTTLWRCLTRELARIFICRSLRAISKPGSGMMRFASRRMNCIFPGDRSGRLF
jgi:malate synthase